ncbi:hypothetical protein [Heyndrickxia acidicola]|uniref:Uncharacterized protein n=1 Tax=Heyndrickxia acidicola TaxID=209389 RepID=A0ABU6MKK5_9BACI|nr:hypothetical protein [Heyndrickxia acidicola]MED1205219.1 hypothetical protein [Heyndrickxia acidicola]
MKTIIVKAVVLICLVFLLVFLLFKLHYSKNNYHYVTITEKYYSQHTNGAARGVISGKEIKLTIIKGEKEACGMEFSNGKIFTLKCEDYLDYRIGQKVYIYYKGSQLIDIRSKQ